MDLKEGDTVVMQSLGTVRIKKLYFSGAALVVDQEERTWLIPKDMFETVELGLFTFA